MNRTVPLFSLLLVTIMTTLNCVSNPQIPFVEQNVSQNFLPDPDDTTDLNTNLNPVIDTLPSQPIQKQPQIKNYIKGKFTPPDGQCLMIVGQDLAGVNGYINGVHDCPGGITQYTDIAEKNQPTILFGLDSTVNWGAGPINVQYACDQFPYSTLVIGLFMSDLSGTNLTNIANGTHDQYVKRLGEFFKTNAPKPIYLRIGYEFDGSWNSYPPNRYIDAYRYLVDYWRGMEVTNVAYVWQGCTYQGPTNIAQWYPGDDYVDWTGSSYFVYNAGAYQEMLNFSREHNKPMMIAEATPQYYDISDLLKLHGNTNTPTSAQEIWRVWFAPLFQFIHGNADVIRALAYINTEWMAQPMWARFWGDSRVETNDYIKNQWLEEMNKSSLINKNRTFWLNGGPDLFDILYGNTSIIDPLENIPDWN